MKTLAHCLLGVCGAVVLAAAPAHSTTRAPAPAPPQNITRQEIETIVSTEVAAQIEAYDSRIRNNSDFDPNKSELQPYYVPIMAQVDLGTFLTVSNISAQVGSFSSGITVSDRESGGPFCVGVEGGVVVAQAGGC